MATTYTDTFTRSGALAGSTTVGGSAWAVTGGTATTNGSQAVLGSGALATLNIGIGEAEVQARIFSTGAIVVRADGSGRGYRARLYSVSNSGGYYATRPYYSATYYSGNAACNSQISTSRGQCNSSSFPSTTSGNCTSGPNSVNANFTLSSVVQNGTCQEYVSTSSTDYYVVLERVAAGGAVTTLHTVGTGSQPVVRLVAQGTAVRMYTDGTLRHTATDSDAGSRASGQHGLEGFGTFDDFFFTVLNEAPVAPLLLSPPDTGVVDRTSPVVLSWQFSDPNPADTQSQYELSLKLTGGTATVYTEATPTTSRTLPAGFLPVGTYEWSVRTYDALGFVGPWSAVGYFTAATPPPSPTLTAPTQDGTIPTELYTVTWSAPVQDAYRMRRTADVSSPGDAQVYQDSGVVEAPAARTATLMFPVNQRPERVWVQVRSGGLWTPWVSASVTVDYAPPATPVLTITPICTLSDEYLTGTTDALSVVIDNPTPTGSQPAVLHNDLYIDDADGYGETQRARVLPVNSTYLYRLPRSKVDYIDLIRVVAVAANGTTSSSS